jgi:hypothetical protein
LDANFKNEHFWSNEYIQKSAQDKMNDLWDMVKSSNMQQGQFPSAVQLGGMFLEDMTPTMKAPGDAMPNGVLWGSRTKYIHSVGTVGKIKYVSEDNDDDYTGIFKGAEHGLIRLSSAAQPSASQPLAPGFGLKFLRDGVDSANLVAMYSVEGQPNNWNFFGNDFTNHVSDATSTKLKLLSAKFASATNYVTEVGLRDWANFEQSGQQAQQRKYPFQLKFTPHEQVNKMFSTSLNAEKNYMKYMDELVTVPEGATLYEVHALNQPTEMGGQWKKIGELQLDGKLVKSKWADENLFFRHGYMDYDLADHNEWTKYTPKFCPFGF